MFINERLKKIYSGMSLEYETKSLSLFYVILCISAIGIALSSMYVATSEGEITLSTISGYLLSLIMGTGMYFLFKGKYKIASNITLFTTMLVIFYVNLTNRDADLNPVFAATLAAAYFTPIIVSVGLYGYARWQVLVIAGVSLVNLFTIYLVKMAPLSGMEGALTRDPLFSFITSTFGPLLVSVFIFFIHGNQEKTMTRMKEAFALIKTSYNRITGMIDSFKSGMAVGKDLGLSATRTVTSLQEIDQFIQVIIKNMENLSGMINKTQASYQSLVSSKETVQNRMEDQAAAVSESAASVEEMAQSI
ncbi:MAG: hypothetical protein JW969_09390 [Spirochaetales bacterium]|nr:hypothetical protein [Spirochaetales bacterium]